jgi:hypothetical protein
MENIFPKKNLSGWLGKAARVWKKLFVETIIIPQQSAPTGDPDGNTGWLYCKDKAGASALYFENDAGSVSEIAVTATAFDDIGDPDAAGTIAFTTYAQTLTSTKTDDDMVNIQGLGNFGDVSVMRVEQKTGNPTDGTVLEVVAADANVDPLVVSSSAQANALVVGQNAGTVAIAAAATVGGTLDVTGAGTVGGTLGVTGLLTDTAGAVLGTSKIITETTNLTSAQVKALKATPIALTAAPGSDKFIQLIGATLVLDYGSNAFTESADNLVIEYETSGVDATAAITANGFLTATADTLAVVVPAAIAGAATASFNGKKLMLLNSGDGEIAGNAANDSVLTVCVTYAVHTLGLA